MVLLHASERCGIQGERLSGAAALPAARWRRGGPDQDELLDWLRQKKSGARLRPDFFVYPQARGPAVRLGLWLETVGQAWVAAYHFVLV